MPKNTSVSIGDHFNEFIDRQVKTGRYGSVSDVIRAGLRLLEENENKIQALQAALAEGEQSGPAEDFDFNAFLNEKNRQLQ